MKRKTIIILLVVAVILITAVYFIFFKKSSKSLSVENPSNDTTGKTEPTASSKFPLRRGSKDTNKEVAVKNLQKYLNYFRSGGNLILNPLVIDGVWGSNTEIYFYNKFKKNTLTENEYITYVLSQIDYKPVI